MRRGAQQISETGSGLCRLTQREDVLGAGRDGGRWGSQPLFFNDTWAPGEAPRGSPALSWVPGFGTPAGERRGGGAGPPRREGEPGGKVSLRVRLGAGGRLPLPKGARSLAWPTPPPLSPSMARFSSSRNGIRAQRWEPLRLPSSKPVPSACAATPRPRSRPSARPSPPAPGTTRLFSVCRFACPGALIQTGSHSVWACLSGLSQHRV